ncbi:MAG: hypothetical protein PHR07_03530 [Acidaminococcaceae bacterium]|nr:hypothetical protein [Acidaminococcaceae bacterium]
MNDFINDLAQWGCNVDTALERFDGDRELYLECLEIFNKDKNFSDLGQLLQAEKYGEAFNCAHALKGVTANLSLAPLLEVITSISEALKQGLYSKAEENYKVLLIKKQQYDKIVNP